MSDPARVVRTPLVTLGLMIAQHQKLIGRKGVGRDTTKRDDALARIAQEVSGGKEG